MINKYNSNIGIPFFSEGSLKTWQKVQNYSNNFVVGSKRIEKTRLPSFVLPYSSTGAQIDKIELYKIIGAISNAFSYDYFITLRSLVYEIDTTDLINSFTFEALTFNSFLGKTVTELISGVYEIVVTMDDTTVFESETILVGCPEFKQTRPIGGSSMYKTETFTKTAIAGATVECVLSFLPIDGSIIIFVNGQFITNYTKNSSTISFVLDYNLEITDIITIIYAYTA
jgi:hypothetical protein